MLNRNGRILLSPSDLNDFVECRHRTTLARQVALVLYAQALRRAQLGLVIVAQAQLADQPRRLGGDTLALVVAAIVLGAARMAVAGGHQKMS